MSSHPSLHTIGYCHRGLSGFCAGMTLPSIASFQIDHFLTFLCRNTGQSVHWRPSMNWCPPSVIGKASLCVELFPEVLYELPVCVYSVRDGAMVEMLARWLVPGDLIHITLGDRVPADIRLFEVGVV